jgi:hypothetical protein
VRAEFNGFSFAKLNKERDMKESRSHVLNRIGALLLLSFSVAACASSSSQRVVTPSAEITEGTNFAVGEVSLSSSETSPEGIDVEQLMTRSLEKALLEAGNKWNGDPLKDYAIIDIEVTNYEPGNAFGRWLMPGVGATVLSVEGTLLNDDRSTVLATIRDERGVYAGGAYTLGAWDYIFDVVADDIVRGLDRKAEGDAFVVEVPTWLKRDLPISEAKVKQTFVFNGVEDLRGEKYRIGERFAAFGVSMGDVYFYRSVPDFVEEMVVTDLKAAGHSLVNIGTGIPLKIAIKRFSARTETTALYWDTIADIEMSATVGSLEQAFTCEASERTYVWPTEELFNTVVDRCLKDLMSDFRNDPIWQSAIPTT